MFFPIDGFADHNLNQVIAARDELATLLVQIFGCEVKVGWLDKAAPEMEF